QAVRSAGQPARVERTMDHAQQPDAEDEEDSALKERHPLRLGPSRNLAASQANRTAGSESTPSTTRPKGSRPKPAPPRTMTAAGMNMRVRAQRHGRCGKK